MKSEPTWRGNFVNATLGQIGDPLSERAKPANGKQHLSVGAAVKDTPQMCPAPPPDASVTTLQKGNDWSIAAKKMRVCACADT
jgi:hypothetical protein